MILFSIGPCFNQSSMTKIVVVGPANFRMKAFSKKIAYFSSPFSSFFHRVAEFNRITIEMSKYVTIEISKYYAEYSIVFFNLLLHQIIFLEEKEASRRLAGPTLVI